MESTEEVKPVKWSEARPGEIPEKEAGATAREIPPREVATLSGWEGVPEALREAMKLKIAKEVGGLTPANTPAAPFDPERDLPTVR